MNPQWDKYIEDCISLGEQQMLDPLYTQNAALNKAITLEELDRFIQKAKNKKNPGTDTTPYDILKAFTLGMC